MTNILFPTDTTWVTPATWDIIMIADVSDSNNPKDCTLAELPISTATQTALDAKQWDITLTTTGTSGAATLIGDTLNIPQYSWGWASTFIGLTDTPSSYTGQTGKFPKVNAGETALEFVTLAGGGDALTSNPLSQFASTTSAQLAGVISDETGSGALVFATSPTLVTPVLGVATATSINGATITSGTLNGSVTGTNTGDNATNSNYTTLATTLATANSWSAVQTFTSPLITNWAINFNAPEGFMVNGKIVPSVASGNLTLTLTGTSATLSATNPCYVMIGGVTRTITANLTFTMNAWTNWFNLGSAELATKEADLFPYIIDGSWGAYMNLWVCRVPNRTNLSEVAYGGNNEKYMEQAWNSGTENCVNIWRFAATLSAGLAWSIPTYTASNLIQRPIYETRLLQWGSQTGWTANNLLFYYKIRYDSLEFSFDANGTSNSTSSYITMPFSAKTIMAHDFALGLTYDNGVDSTTPWRADLYGQYCNLYKDSAYWAWTASGAKIIRWQWHYYI